MSEQIAAVSKVPPYVQIVHGTVKPFAAFNAQEDAAKLRKAMKGLGTDEDAIINILCYRTNQQRQEIISAYKQTIQRDLVKDLKSELGGDLENAVEALMMKPKEYDAYWLNKAMKGLGTTESVLIEILASRSNTDIKEIKEVYKVNYKKDLEKSLISETSGDFKKLLVSLCNAARDETVKVDVVRAAQDAQDLYKAGEKKMGTDEAAFNLVMCSRSFPHLRAVFEEYKKIAKRDIAESITREFSGDIENGLKAIIQIVRSPGAFFAKKIHDAMAGAGTDDHTLIRCIVTRSEIDMVEIKEEFVKLYKKTMVSFIQDDTSGDYKKLLLALIGAA